MANKGRLDLDFSKVQERNRGLRRAQDRSTTEITETSPLHVDGFLAHWVSDTVTDDRIMMFIRDFRSCEIIREEAMICPHEIKVNKTGPSEKHIQQAVYKLLFLEARAPETAKKMILKSSYEIRFKRHYLTKCIRLGIDATIRLKHLSTALDMTFNNLVHAIVALDSPTEEQKGMVAVDTDRAE